MPQRRPTEIASGARSSAPAARLPRAGGRRPGEPELREGSTAPARLLRAGERAAGLAHDLRNALTLAQLAREHETSTLGVELPETARAMDEARQLCARFLTDSGGGAQLQLVRLRELLLRELEAVASLHPDGAAVVLRCPRRLRARTDASALGRAVRNLTLNAVRASAPGSVVRVRARALGALVCVVVDDRGRGMDARELAVAMSPAGTTRGAGGGYGSVSLLDCVRELDARLVVRTGPGVGTRCRLWLPAGSAGAPGERWSVDPGASPRRQRADQNLFTDVAGLARALNRARPAEVRARRTLPRRELERLRALCAQASIPLTVAGLRSF